MAWPKTQSGPLYSASSSTRIRPSRTRFQKPVASDAQWRRPSGPHRGWDTDSSALPATRAPSTHSSVPSHGMLGWSHDSQASRPPVDGVVGSNRGAA